MIINGHIEWKGQHPIAVDAQKVDFTADIEYTVTPLAQGFAYVLNKIAKGYNGWKVGETQSVFKKAFAPFGLSEGKIFKECDLVYLYNDMMFWGARNIDDVVLIQKKTDQQTCKFQWLDKNRIEKLSA